MSGLARQPSGWRVLALVSALLLVVWPARLPAQDGASRRDHQQRVLVLYATRRDAQLVVVSDRLLPQMFDRELEADVDYYSEFIDQARFAQPNYDEAFLDYLLLKYQGMRFDVVIAMGDTPLAFIERTRERFLRDTPAVFFSNQPSRPRPSNSTGIATELNLRDTVSLALALHPDARHLFVVSGSAASNRVFETAARQQLPMFESRLAITYLSGLPIEELEARLATLPPQSIVYYLVLDRDGDAVNFDPLAYVDRLTAVANAPVYSWVDSLIGRGIVGGSLKVQADQARAVGELAIRVLRGEDASEIPVANVDLNVSQVDWRQLRRWRIAESRVPANTRILFRDPTAWERYRPYIFTLIALLLAQGLLIATLLVQRARRRQAEEEVRGSRTSLIESYERIRDLAGRLLKAQEAERARVAGELHDDVSQQVALLEIDLQRLAAGLKGESGKLAASAVNRADTIARSVHDVSHRLHPAKLTLVGLVGAVQGLRREMARFGIPIEFTHHDVPATLPADLTLCAFRVVQEALRNAVKYSGARRISVHLSGSGSELRLSIADDGVGFDEARASWRKGLGLLSMQERAEAVGGTLRIHTAPGKGTRLDVRLPVPAVGDRVAS
jgi:signal transduction histidine kinase